MKARQKASRQTGPTNPRRAEEESQLAPKDRFLVSRLAIYFHIYYFTRTKQGSPLSYYETIASLHTRVRCIPYWTSWIKQEEEDVVRIADLGEGDWRRKQFVEKRLV